MQLRTIFSVLVSLSIGACGVEAQTAPSAPLTVIRAGTMIDGQSDTTKTNRLIFVRGERIEKNTNGIS